MAKNLNVRLDFTANTSQAAASIKSLQSQLAELQKTGMMSHQGLGLTKDVREAISAVGQLQQILSKTTTASGALDLTAFNHSLQSSWGNLDVLNQKLSALGPAGSQAFSQLAQSIATAEIPIRRSSELLSGMATTLANTVRWQLSSSLIHGFVGGLQEAFGYAKDLNESLNNIRIVTGQSADQMAVLAEKANKAARELSTRTTDYTNASLIYYQQGLDDKAVEERTRTTLKLANVSRQSAEEVSTQMTAIWNNFDNGTKSLEYYADAITALGAKTASSSSEIAQGLSKFAAVADTIGLSYETASAAIATVVAETRQSADTVGNAFKSIFSRIESLKLGETLEDGVGLTKYTEALQKVGVEVLDINGNLKDADTILSDLGDKWNQISDTQKVALANTVAGQRQYAQFVALFDNWDKVQENRGIAEDSEGTLQEQQEIYAEGWEASAKRVKAAAEQIYDALISDKFFITLNDFLAGCLDGINALIKGFGGLGGTLTALGALLTNVFNKNIANTIDKIVYNISTLTPKARKAAEALQVDAQKKLEAHASEALKKSSTDMEAKGQSIAYKEQAKLMGQLRENQSKLNNEQLEGVRAVLDQNKALQNTSIQLGQQYELQKKINQEEIQNKRQLLELSARQNGKSAVEASRLGAQFKTESEKYQNQIVSLESFKAIEEPLTAIESSLDSQQEKVSSLMSLYEVFGGSIGALGTNFEGVDAEVSNLQKAFEGLKDGSTTIDDVVQAYQKLRVALETTESAEIQLELSQEALKTVMKECGVDADLQEKILKGLTKEYTNLANKGVQAQQSQIAVGQAARQAGKDMDAAKSAATSFGNKLSAFSSIVLSVSSIFNSLKSAVSSLAQGDFSGLLSVIPSLAMSFGMLYSALEKAKTSALFTSLANSKLGQSFVGLFPQFGKTIAGLFGVQLAEMSAASGAALLKAAFFEILIPIALVIAAFKILTFLGKKLFGFIDDLFETEAEKAERLADEVEKTQKVFEETKTAVEDLKTAFDEYDEARAALDNCKEGTEEWYEALNNVNNKVLELIDEFPQLAQYLTTGENGELTFTPEGREAVTKETTKNNIAATAAKLGAATEQKKNDLSGDRKDLEKKLSSLLESSNGEIVEEALAIAGVNNFDDISDVADQIINNGINISEALATVYGDIESTNSEQKAAAEAALRQYAVQSWDMGLGGVSPQGTTPFSSMSKEAVTQKDENGNYLVNSDVIYKNLKEWGYLPDAKSFDEMAATHYRYKQQENPLEDSEFVRQVNAMDQINGAYKGNMQSMTSEEEGYAKALGQQAAQLSEEVKNSPYLEQIESMSGQLFQTLLNQEKEAISNSNRDLGEDFYNYVKANHIPGFTDLDKKGNYKDGEEEREVSEEVMTTMMAATKATEQFAEIALKAGQKVDELGKSSDKAKNGFSEFLLGKRINTGGNALQKEFESYSKVYNGDKRKMAEAVIDSKIGTGNDGKIKESTAQEYGFESKELMIDAFLAGLEENVEDVEKARETGSKLLNRYYENLVKGSNSAVDDLDVDKQEKIGDLLRQSMEKGGASGLAAMQDILMNTSDLSGTIDALTEGSINWVETSAEDLSKYFKRLGITIDGLNDGSLETLIETMKQLEEISFESATEQFKSLHDIIEGLEKGDTIKSDEADILKEFDPSIIENYFTPMADGTYKLIGDAEEFYNYVNNQSLEAFRQGWQQEMQKAGDAQRLQETYGEKNASPQFFNAEYQSVINSQTGAVDKSKMQHMQDQIAYLRAIGAEAVQVGDKFISLNEIETDLMETGTGYGKLNSETFSALHQMLSIHYNDWDLLAEGQEEAEKNADAYVKMMVSSAPDLQSLFKIFDKGKVFEGIEGIDWKTLVTMWKEIFSTDDVEKNISSLEDFKNAIAEIDGEAALSNVEQSWHKIKDQIKLTTDDLYDFVQMQDQISPEDFAEGIQQIADSATSIEELDRVIEAADGLGIDFTDTIINLLDQSNMTTAETIHAIVEELIKGNGEADKLAGKIVELYKENDSEQSTNEAVNEMNTGFEDAKKGISQQRMRINGPNATEQGEALNQAEKALNKQQGLATIEYAQNADDMFSTDRLKLYQQGVAQMGKDVELTTIEMRQMGQAATEIANSMGSWDVGEKVSFIKEAFGGDNIDPDNMRAYADAIKDIYVDENNGNINETLENITENLINAGVPAEYLKEEILAILTQNGNSTEGAINSLNTMLENGKISGAEYLSLLQQILSQNSSTPLEQLDLIQKNQGNIVEQGQQDFIQDRSNRGQVSELTDENISAAGTQAVVDQYQSVVNGLGESSFSDIDSYMQFFEMLPSGVEYSDKLKTCFDGIKDSFTNLDQLQQFEDFLNKIGQSDLLQGDAGKDLFNQVFDQDVKDLGFDPEEVRDYASVIKEDLTTSLEELADSENDLNDEAKILLKNHELLEKQALLQARAEQRIAQGTKDLVDHYDEWADVLSRANKELKNNGKVSSDTQKDLTKFNKEISSTVKNLLNLSDKDFEMLPKDFAAKNLDLLKDVADGVPGAYEECADRARDAIVQSFDSGDISSQAQEAISHGFSMDELVSKAQEQMNQLSGIIDDFESTLDPIELEAKLNSDEFLAQCNAMVQQAGITSDAAQAYFAAMGYSVEITEDPEEIKDLTTTKNQYYYKPASYSQGTTLKEGGGDKSTPGDFYQLSLNSPGEWIKAESEATEEYGKPAAYAIKTITPSGASSGGDVSRKSSGGGGGGRGGGCFIAGTLISTANGFKNIEDIQIGDIVLSYNEILKRNEYSKVLETMIHIVGDRIYDLYIENEKITCTGIHRFLITRYGERKWIEAQGLKVGDFVQFADGSLHRIQKIDSNVTIKVVYNFEVDGNHNYYVGKNQILAHNKGRGGRGRGGRGRTERVSINATVDKKTTENRYANVDRSLQNLNTSYDKINKIKDLAFGKKHLDALKQEIELNKQLIETNKQKYDQTKKYTTEDSQKLTSGVTADYSKKSTTKGLTEEQKKELAQLKALKKKTKKQKKRINQLNSLSKNQEVEITENASSQVSLSTIDGEGSVTRDASGNITGMNYEELKQKNVDKYNQRMQDLTEKMKAATTDAERRRLENLKSQYEAEYDALEEYIDKVWQDLQDLQDRINDMIDQEISMLEKQIEKAVYLIDQKLEIDDSSISLLDFKINKLGDSGRNAAAQIGLISEKIKTLNTKAGDNMQGIKNLFSTVANKDNVKTIEGDTSGQKFTADWDKKNGFLNGDELVNQMSSSNEDDRKKAQATLLEMYKLGTLTTKQMDEIKARAQEQLSIVEEMRSTYQEIFDLMGNALNYYNAKMDDIINQQEHLNNLVTHYRNVIDLVGKSQIAGSRAAGRAMEEQLDTNSKSIANQNIKTYKEQLEGAEKLRDQLAAQRANAEARMNDQSKSASYREEWAQTYEKYDELYKNQAAKANEAQENMNSAFETALQTNLDSWTRAMDRAVEAFQEKMAGTAVSLDYLAEALDRYSKTHSTYVQDYEKVHQLRMLDLQAQKSIDEATDPKIKRELLEIQQEITAATTKDAKMSQYDLDFLKQKLELKQAEAAFEDAQKAKTQVSLTRDNEGNFGYVYTANDEDVQNAEQNYADKIYEMQKANAEYIQSLQTELVNAEQEYYQKMQEIANNTNLSTAEREAKMTKISEDYSALHEALTEQFQEALIVSNDIYGEYSNKYAEITGDLTACNLDYIGDFSQTRLAVETNYTSMKEFAEQWETATVAYMSDLKVAMEQYQADNKSTFESAGEDMSTYASTVKTQTDEIKKQTEALTTAMNTMATQADTDFTAIVTAAQKAEEAYVGYMNSMTESVEYFTDALIGAQEQMVNLGDITGSTTPSGTTITGDSGNNPGEQTPVQAGSGNHGSITIWRQRGYKRIVKGLTAYQLRNVRAYKNKMRQLKRSSAWQRAQRRRNQAKLAKLREKYIAKAAQAARNSLLNQLKKKKVNKVVVKYDTGGYTGTWNNNEGKLAMLHQKELVLNKEDTQNILSAVSTVRDLANKIDLNALASQGAFSSTNAAGVGNLKNELEQHVSIEANFPNATSREEIQAAFENLIGLASQYANRSA